MAPGDLEQALGGLFDTRDSRILAGGGTDAEDAFVLRFPPGQALVQTVDFFTPVVNDPYDFGQVAAANSLSDIYAMGAKPLAAMNIFCFPAKNLPAKIMRAILEGGRDKVLESGAVPSGGHSVEDPEIKYGLAVSGTVDPDRIASNRGAKPGEVLVLTKPIGTGVLATALKADWQGFEEIEADMVRWCARLNKAGAEAIRELGLTGATDVTGFGLAGHLLEVARASNVSAEIRVADVPLMDRAFELASMGLMPAGSICNRNHFLPDTHIDEGLDPILVDLMFDAQTSGGLLLSVPEAKLDRCLEILHQSGDLSAVIGQMKKTVPGEKRIQLV